jgi:hypothetical protein
MDISNFNQLLSEPLIPAISILLILVFIFLVYKFQQYRQSQKPILQIPVIDENIKKRRPQQDQPKPLVVPSSNKTHGVTNEAKQTPALESVELDDDPQEKPLFPSQPSAPHEPEISCDDLYKELLDPDAFEEALYKELLEGTGIEDKAQPHPEPQAKTPESKTTAPATPGKTVKPESESELLLTEIEKEFMELEKDLHGGNNALEENPYLHPDYFFPDNNDISTSANSLPQKDLSVKDLQLEMEETIAKLSQQVSQEPLERQEKLEETPKKASPIVAKIETVKTTPKEQEIPADKTPKTQPKPVIKDPSKNDQYVERLKSFQSNMEQRFGSFDIANDSIRSRASNEDSLVDRIAYSASNVKNSAKDEKNSLELLESFLFTANQRSKKH